MTLWTSVDSPEYSKTLRWLITEDAELYLSTYLYLTHTNLKTVKFENQPLTRIELGPICRFKYDSDKKIWICRTSVPNEFKDSKINIGLKDYYLKFKLDSLNQFKYPPIPAYLVQFKELIENYEHV